MKQEKYISKSVEETKNIGFNFAKMLNKGDVVAFYGNLGVGKTEFIRGICNLFNINDYVSSPTYTIINEYIGRIGEEEQLIYHLDLYRIKDKEELINIGYYDYVFQDSAVTLIEWAENSYDELPKNHIKVKIDISNINLNGREITISHYFKNI